MQLVWLGPEVIHELLRALHCLLTHIFIGDIFESTATREPGGPFDLGIFSGRQHFIDDYRDVLNWTSTFDSPFPSTEHRHSSLLSSSRPFQRTTGSPDPLQDLHTLQQHT